MQRLMFCDLFPHVYRHNSRGYLSVESSFEKFYIRTYMKNVWILLKCILMQKVIILKLKWKKLRYFNKNLLHIILKKYLPLINIRTKINVSCNEKWTFIKVSVLVYRKKVYKSFLMLWDYYFYVLINFIKKKISDVFI